MTMIRDRSSSRDQMSPQNLATDATDDPDSIRVIRVTDFCDYAFTKQATRKKLHPVIVHELQQLLSTLVHVANTREVN